MGKHTRKSKTTTDAAVMDLSLGVLTRAKALALRRRHPPSPSPSYLQLRSRRLLKPPPPPPIILHYSKRRKQGRNKASKEGPLARAGHAGEEEGAKRETGGKEVKKKNGNDGEGGDDDESDDLDIEGSFGENILDTEGKSRSTRESTPCSLIRDPETIRTPGSTTRTTSSSETNRKIHNSLRRRIPTAVEMDEFFARAEEEQKKQFVEKYNFDPTNDKPLPGRFEWEKLDP